MHIGLVLHNIPTYSETFFNNKIRALQKSGFDVTLFISGSGNYKLCKTVKGFNYYGNFIKTIPRVISLITNLTRSPVRSYKLFKHNQSDGFTLRRNLTSLVNSAHIIGHNLDYLHFGFAEIAIGRENLAKTIGASMAVSVRGYDVALYPLKRPGCYDLVWNRLDKLHYLSNHLLSRAIKLGFNATIKSHEKITPAIDLSIFVAESPLTNRYDNPKLVLLSVARLHWIKGLDDSIIALSYLHDIDFEYHIIGEGYERERISFLIEDLGLKDKVILHGKQDQHYIKKYMAIANLYIQYSEHEGFCNAVLEAQSMGLFCIVSNNSGITESINEGFSGLSIEKRNPEQLAKAVINYWKLPQAEKIMHSESAIDWVRNHFSITAQAEHFVNFYRN